MIDFLLEDEDIYEYTKANLRATLFFQACSPDGITLNVVNHLLSMGAVY
jgi:hypothetical protein